MLFFASLFKFKIIYSDVYANVIICKYIKRVSIKMYKKMHCAKSVISNAFPGKKKLLQKK